VYQRPGRDGAAAGVCGIIGGLLGSFPRASLKARRLVLECGNFTARSWISFDQDNYLI
jgi:hypothetical protein